MPPENEKPSEIAPEAREALTNLRDGLERAHEIVAEAKLTIRQLAQEPPTPAAEGPLNPTG